MMKPHLRKLNEEHHHKEHLHVEHHPPLSKTSSQKISGRRLNADTNQGSPREDPGDGSLSESARKVQDQILDHLRGPTSSSLDASVLARNHDPGPVDVIVPVFQTLKIKHLVDDLSLNEGEVAIIGTMVQRTLGVDLKEWRRSSDLGEGHFSYRVNERGGQMDNFEVRKTVLAPMTSIGGDAGGLMARSTTLAVKLPTDRYTILDADPFCIIAVTCLLELTSTDGSTPEGYTQSEVSSEEEKIGGRSFNVTLRPDLWAHLQDPRNLVTVKDHEDIDHCRCYDLVNPSPTIEYFHDKTDGRLYVPKMRITFFMEKYAYGNFFETLLPIIFCNLASTLNFVFNAGAGCRAESSVNDFLDNSLTLGLTVIFLIPRLVQREAFVTTNFSLDDLFVLGVMVSLILGLFPECIPGDKGSGYLLRIPSISIHGSPALPLTQWGAMLIGWGSLGIPLYNFFLYREEKQRIKKGIPRPKEVKGATFDSFIGEPGSKTPKKPKGKKKKSEGDGKQGGADAASKGQQPQNQKKGSDICFDDLHPWYQWTQHEKDRIPDVTADIRKTDWYQGRWDYDKSNKN